MSNILKGLNEGRSYGRDSWDSNMPGYQGDYGGAENWGRRNREDDEHHEIDAVLAARHAQRQEYERNGKFWLKLKDSQRHLPAGPFTGKQAANIAAVELLKQQPELKGNLLITAYGPDETQGVAEGSRKSITPEQMIRDAIEAYKQESAKENPNPYILDSIRTNINDIKREIERKKQGVEEGLSDIVKGVKRKVAGKEDPKEVEHMYGRIARSAIKNKTPDQAEKDIERYKKVSKVVNKESVAEGSIGAYVLNVMDEATGEHWAIEIQASSPEMATERARQQGYKVLRIKENGVAEGLGKSIKRAAQGWGIGGAPDMVTPAGAVKAFKDMDGQRLANFVASRKDLSEPRQGSARAFADKVIDREMRQRGYGRVADKDEQGVAEGLSESLVSKIEELGMIGRVEYMGPEYKTPYRATLQDKTTGKVWHSDFNDGKAAEDWLVDTLSKYEQWKNKHQDVAEDSKEQEYGPEWDEKIKRLGQMAKQGERKTVWDPVKRVYKTVPIQQSSTKEGLDDLDENLHQWFKEKWVRFGPDGKIRGDCARGDDSEGKPKCLPQSKAQNLGKKGRASAAARKRREDPNPERSGKAINVNTKKKTNEGEVEGSSTTWEVSYDYGPHMSKTVTVKASSEDEARAKVEKAAEKKGLSIMINSVEPASQVNEFASDGFNGGDDGFSPEIAKMAQDDGFTKGVSLADGATLERAMAINYWHSQHGGMYKQYFAKGFKAGRMEKIRHDNKQYNLNLKLMKDGSIRHGEQGVAEEQLDELSCWSGYHRVAGTKAGFPGSCAKNKTNEEQEQHSESCPHCGGEMVSEELMNEKKDACYYKVKSRYKVWPSAYASGALVKCRKKGASNWGTGGKSNESIEEDQLDEKWTKKYKDSINCSNPKGFSQKAHCASKQKNESAIMKGLK